MPLYFFHLSFGDRTVPDDEGVELPSRSAAREEALAVIRDLSNPEVAGNPRRWASWFLQVVDEGAEFPACADGPPGPESHHTKSPQSWAKTTRGKPLPPRHDGCRPTRPPFDNACSADGGGEEAHRTITPTKSTAAAGAFFSLSRQREHTRPRQPRRFARPACFAGR